MDNKLHGDSADILIYRYEHGDRGDLEILTGIRQHEPWKGYITIPFGGHVKPSDANLLAAAKREVEEETGLVICEDFFVGIYGPRRRHHGLDKYMEAIILGPDRPSVNHVFAGHIVDGKLENSEEQGSLRFVCPNEFINKRIAFDHALVLTNFLDALHDGSAYTWRREALMLIK